MPLLSAQTRAILLMLASTACFSLMNILIRYASLDLHSTVIVFFRNVFCVVLLLPIMLSVHGGGIRTDRPRGHFWRATVGIIGMQAWFYSLTILPLNQATALSYTSPLFSTLFAVLYLHEKASRTRWLALFVGFLGAMLILRPDPDNFDARALIVVFAATIWAVAGMLVKTLTLTEPPLRIVFLMSIIMSLWSLPPALYFWSPVALSDLVLLVGVAAVSIGAQWSLTKAYSLADVSSLMPFDFSRLVFTAILAYLAFGETSDYTTWIGAAIIVLSAAQAARLESRRARAANPPVTGEM
jgi:drug/metabolite transporter (DMT)-like permease